MRPPDGCGTGERGRRIADSTVNDRLLEPVGEGRLPLKSLFFRSEFDTIGAAE
jgi:hypothetical protein